MSDRTPRMSAAQRTALSSLTRGQRRLLLELSGGPHTCPALSGAGVGSPRSCRRWVRTLEGRGLVAIIGREGRAQLWALTDVGRMLTGARAPLASTELAGESLPATPAPTEVRDLPARVGRAGDRNERDDPEVSKESMLPARPTMLRRARPALIGAAVLVGSPLIALAAGAVAWHALGTAVAELAGETRAAFDKFRSVGIAA